MIKQIITNITDVIQGKTNLGTSRSPKWPKVRADHLKYFPKCEVCGSNKGLQVHHIKPFHLDPLLELDPTNLITLCENNGVNCHLTFGHLGSFKSFNEKVVEDSATWNAKLKNRP